MADAGAPTYPVGTIAKLLLLTERRVQQLTKDGIIPRTERGRYELAPAVQGYVRYLQERAHGGNVTSIDFHLEKGRLVKAQADKAETELAEMRGSLVSKEDILDAWAHMLVNIKTRLIGIPSKAATALAMETEPAAVQAALDGYIRDALTELVGYDGSDEATAVGDDSTGTAAEADS